MFKELVYAVVSTRPESIGAVSTKQQYIRSALLIVLARQYLLMTASTNTWIGLLSVSKCTMSKACLTIRTCKQHSG